MIIRNETINDYRSVEELTRNAFYNVYRPGCNEHLVVHKLRDDEKYIKELDYVIEEDNKIVAHIIYALGSIKTINNEMKDALIFGPVSVDPSYQHQGYGKIIIEYSINKAKELGYGFILITGNPAYYSRYGFESASKYHIYYEGMPMDEEAPFFMIKVLDESKLVKGTYSDPSVYNVSSSEVDEFEKQFEFKLKQVNENQLTFQSQLKLVKLTYEYKNLLIEMLKEWREDHKLNNANHSPWAIFKNDEADFDNYLANLELKEAKDGKVPDSTYFVYDSNDNKLVGACNIRHYLNDYLLAFGGHIGYGIRPSYRKKGYATTMLYLALQECKKLHIDKVLVTCDKTNLGSAKTIQNNGGILENEVINEDNEIEQRYWIDNK